MCSFWLLWAHSSGKDLKNSMVILLDRIGALHCQGWIAVDMSLTEPTIFATKKLGCCQCPIEKEVRRNTVRRIKKRRTNQQEQLEQK
eukprot:3584698-Amphidinium_carterae.1